VRCRLHLIYLRNGKKVLLTATAIAVFLALWWIIAALSNSILFPTPWETFRAFLDILASGKSWYHIGITTYRVVTGMLIGSLAGTLLGIATRYSAWMKTAVNAVIYPLLQSVPTICWALVFVLWFGLSDITPILAIATAVRPFL